MPVQKPKVPLQELICKEFICLEELQFISKEELSSTSLISLSNITMDSSFGGWGGGFLSIKTCSSWIFYSLSMTYSSWIALLTYGKKCPMFTLCFPCLRAGHLFRNYWFLLVEIYIFALCGCVISLVNHSFVCFYLYSVLVLLYFIAW